MVNDKEKTSYTGSLSHTDTHILQVLHKVRLNFLVRLFTKLL